MHAPSSPGQRPGIVDLRDLQRRYAWQELAVRRILAATGLVPSGPATPRFRPPRVLVVVAPLDDAALMARSRAWLEDAARLFVIRDHFGSEASGDASLLAVADAEWREVLAELSVPAEVSDWRSEADWAPVLERARRAAEREPDQPSPALPPIVEHEPGPSLQFTIEDYYNVARTLAAQLVPTTDGVVLHTGDGLRRLDEHHDAPVALPLAGSAQAVAAHGSYLRFNRDRSWSMGDVRFPAPGRFALGFDGVHPVGWVGHRMQAFWLYAIPGGAGFLSASDHDYPCGPAKKLYGHADNDPVGVSLAPDLGAVAYRFEHDVLVTSAIPVAWRQVGDVDVADFPRDDDRAVLFARRPDAFPVDGMDLEDARDLAPVVVLGPSPAVRYAVDLRYSAYRITAPAPNRGAVTGIGGPEHGFAVFDDKHREVRRATGRLLGGWWRYATILEGDSYVREDLATGRRRVVARVDEALGEVVAAVPMPWTRNVVVVFAAGDVRRLALV